jgi:hypothetical protein
MNVGIEYEVAQFHSWKYKKIKIQKNIFSVVTPNLKKLGNVTV